MIYTDIDTAEAYARYKKHIEAKSGLTQENFSRSPYYCQAAEGPHPRWWWDYLQMQQDEAILAKAFVGHAK